MKMSRDSFSEISEYDDYRVPLPYTGEMTPDIIAKKKKNHIEAEKKKKELLKRLRGK